MPFETTTQLSPADQAIQDMEPSEESQYIASRTDGLPVGPTLGYSFETQEGQPYDGSNRMARKLSPFTIRLVPPAALLPQEKAAAKRAASAAQGAPAGGMEAEAARAAQPVKGQDQMLLLVAASAGALGVLVGAAAALVHGRAR